LIITAILGKEKIAFEKKRQKPVFWNEQVWFEANRALLMSNSK
jgi:hypothetical protein